MAVNVDFEFNKNKMKLLLKSFQAIGEEARKETRQALESASEETANYAKQNHRYATRTANLERHTLSEVFAEQQSMAARIFIDEDNAPYGPHIHKGFKTWSPDEFIFKAVDVKKEMIFRRLNKGIDRAIKKAGF